ncbi:MAG: ABC transporter substrate-binding protein [Dehalococcoidia bacterium]
MNILSKKSLISVSLLLFLLAALCACGGDNGTGEPTPTATTEPVEDVEVIIGNLTDLTGVSSPAQQVINYALEDLVNYFNDEDLIPGVELKIVEYDTQFEPSNDIPGYELLKRKGVDLIITGVTSAPMTLKPRVNEDQMLLFPLSGNATTLEPPGYVFSPASLPEHEAMTLLKWIAENRWDYESKGPAVIGGASWKEPNGEAFMGSAEAYAKAHPDQFEWEGAYFTEVKFNWAPEVEALMDCDYLFIPNPMSTFVKQYREAGGQGNFIGNGPHFAFLNVIDDANLWDEIDGMLVVTPTKWWGEDGELVDLREKLLYASHSESKAEEIKRMGGAYNAMDNIYIIIDIIRRTAEKYGPQNINSETLYETAKSYSLVIDGVERYSYGETKRYAANYYRIYEASEEDEQYIQTNDEWLYHVTSP